MKIHPSVAVIATSMAFGAYYSYRFVRRRHMIEYPRLNPRLNLSQLPEEIILLILQAVHDDPIPNRRCRFHREWTRYDQGTRDIKNVRLTCQLFNRISSELLIKFVGVDLSVESLARLKTIMHHPTIGKGVGMVRIRLLAYDPILGISRFVDEMRSHLNSYTSQMSQVMDRETKQLADWYFEGSGLGVPSVRKKFLAAAEPAHREYRRRYHAQQGLSKLDFIRDVSNALAMSRKPLRIEFTDRDDFIWSNVRATKHNLLDVISTPRASTWRGLEARSQRTSRDYAWMIPPMLIHFAESHVRIVDLHFDTTTTLPDQVFLTKVYSREMKVVMQNLRSFTYHNDDLMDILRDGPKWKSVLQKCLSAASLRDLVLRSVKLEPMSKFRNLTRISLTKVEFNVERLTLLLEPLEPHTVDISLNKCIVYDKDDNDGDDNSEADDSWADILDLLRSKQRWTRLNWPKGWDIFNMSRENINYLFVHLPDWHGGASKAEQYVRGWLDVNPLRQHLDYSIFDQ